MKLTLANVHYSARLSQETNAFDATVLLNGKPFASASNHGTGGQTDVRPIFDRATQTHNHAQFDAAVAEINAWIATQPKRKDDVGGGRVFEWEWTLDGLVDDALEAHLAEKDLARLMKKYRVTHRPKGGLVTTLNDLPMDEALAIFRKGADLYQQRLAATTAARR